MVMTDDKLLDNDEDSNVFLLGNHHQYRVEHRISYVCNYR